MKKYPISNILIDYDGIGECIGDLIGLGNYLGWRY